MMIGRPDQKNVLAKVGCYTCLQQNVLRIDKNRFLFKLLQF